MRAFLALMASCLLFACNASPDNDASPSDVNCGDDNASIHSGADEIPYDGIDQDCSGGDLIDVDDDGFEASQVDGPDCDDTTATTCR